MSARDHHERGATAIMVAATLVFLFGAAALAVDVSGFYSAARTDQNAADLACLAGAGELPDTAAAANVSRQYVELNWPDMAGATFTAISGDLWTMSKDGQVVEIETTYDGDAGKMRVAITSQEDATFSRVLGADAVPVAQEAICSTAPGGGTGGLPFGVLPGGFGGGIFGPNPCGTNTGNCGALDLPRDGYGGGADTVEDNIALSSERILVPHHGTPDAVNPAVDCGTVNDGDQCSIADTKTGVNTGKIGEGFRRLLETDDTTCTEFSQGVRLDCSTPTDILGGAPLDMSAANGGSPPAGWDDSLYGVWGTQDPAVWKYWNGTSVDCANPRLAIIPIVSKEMDWDLGDLNPGWPSGKKKVKVVGLLNVIITQPFGASDFEPGGGIKHASVMVVWFGPNATCSDGQPVGVNNGVLEVPATQGVKLVSG